MHKRIAAAELGAPVLYEECYGDLWFPTWADDDDLYVALDDASGFGPWKTNFNLMLVRLDGTDPSRPGTTLKGCDVNYMEEYGRGCELQADGACWKAMGLTSVDGSLYLAVSRHRYLDERIPVNHAWDASILRSDDHGKTWSPQPKLGTSMFSGSRFSTPFFVQYGQDGHGSAHESDRYVYAVSNDGSWNNGSSMVLGRCLKTQLPRLDGRDWEFVQAIDDHWEPVWGPRHETARLIFRSPGRASETGMHFIEQLGLYILPQWHFPDLERTEWPLMDRFKRSVFEFYQAPNPWGPWELFHTCEWPIEGFYNPSIPAKFISADGTSLCVFTSGGFAYLEGEEHFQEYYTLCALPMTLRVEEVSPG